MDGRFGYQRGRFRVDYPSIGTIEMRPDRDVWVENTQGRCLRIETGRDRTGTTPRWWGGLNPYMVWCLMHILGNMDQMWVMVYKLYFGGLGGLGGLGGPLFEFSEDFYFFLFLFFLFFFILEKTGPPSPPTPPSNKILYLKIEVITCNIFNNNLWIIIFTSIYPFFCQ